MTLDVLRAFQWLLCFGLAAYALFLAYYNCRLNGPSESFLLPITFALIAIAVKP